MYDLIHTGSPPLVNGCYSTAWLRTRMASCRERLSGAPSMEAYLNDCKTTRNPPEFAKGLSRSAEGLIVQNWNFAIRLYT